MASLNKVYLIGNLTRDPELRYTPSGRPVTQFRLAVNRRYRDKDGNQREDTVFVDVEAWGYRAETANERLAKGWSALVEGRLKLDEWTGRDGQRRSKLMIVAERVQSLGQAGRVDTPADQGDASSSSAKDSGGRSSGNRGDSNEDDYNDNLPGDEEPPF